MGGGEGWGAGGEGASETIFSIGARGFNSELGTGSARAQHRLGPGLALFSTFFLLRQLRRLPSAVPSAVMPFQAALGLPTCISRPKLGSIFGFGATILRDILDLPLKPRISRKPRKLRGKNAVGAFRPAGFFERLSLRT